MSIVKFKKIINKLLAYIAVICILIIAFLTIFEFIVFDLNYYPKEYTKHGVLNNVQMDMNDLMKVTEHMLSYLKGETNDLSIVVNVAEKERDFFNDREKAHMVDVQKLFLDAYKIRVISIILFAISIVILLLLKADVLKLIINAFVVVSIIILSVWTLIFILTIANFDKYFTLFHEVFFDNDLWILNPKTDLLINIVPLGFFINITRKICIWFGIFLAIPNVIVIMCKAYLKEN